MKKITMSAALALFLALSPQIASAASSPPPAVPSSSMIRTAPVPPPLPAMMAAPVIDNHIDGELAFLKVELKITDSQERAWNNFAKAAQEGSKAIGQTSVPMGATTKIIDMLDAKTKSLKTRLDVLEKLKDALDPLYEDLDAGQKTAANQLIPMHLGMLFM